MIVNFLFLLNNWNLTSVIKIKKQEEETLGHLLGALKIDLKKRAPVLPFTYWSNYYSFVYGQSVPIQSTLENLSKHEHTLILTKEQIFAQLALPSCLLSL